MWVPRNVVPGTTLDLIIHALGFGGRILVEFADSENPEDWSR
jgi:hypothetical protein